MEMVSFTFRPLSPSVLIEEEAQWLPELLWTFWRTEKCLAVVEIRTPDHPVGSLSAGLHAASNGLYCAVSHIQGY